MRVPQKINIEYEGFAIGEQVYYVNFRRPHEGEIAMMFVNTELGRDFKLSVVEAYSLLTDNGYAFVSANKVFATLEEAQEYIEREEAKR